MGGSVRPSAGGSIGRRRCSAHCRGNAIMKERSFDLFALICLLTFCSAGVTKDDGPDEKSLADDIGKAVTQSGVRLSSGQVDGLVKTASKQQRDVAFAYATNGPSDRISALAAYLEGKSSSYGGGDLTAKGVDFSDFSWKFLSPEWKGAKFLPLKNDGSVQLTLKEVESSGRKASFTPAALLKPGDSVVAPVFDRIHGQTVTAYYTAKGMPATATMYTGSYTSVSLAPNLYGNREKVFIAVISMPPGSKWYLNKTSKPIEYSQKAYVARGAHFVRVVNDGHEDYCDSNSNVTVDWVVSALLVRKGGKVNDKGKCPNPP